MQDNREIGSVVPNTKVRNYPLNKPSSNFIAFKSVTAMVSRF